ncbi:hypothetical protein [Robertmurraya sp. P23]|uniref:hypothetical protein n=1 Tax=Robertmurraya sp. P23 TaxID=3436931 RepID=UPI003D957E9C
MKCVCDNYKDLDLQRNDISKRIKESKLLKTHLKTIVKPKNSKDKLYQCDICNQFWQGSFAWNFGNVEYLFKVPFTEIVEWENEHYIAPDKILIYLALMERYLKENAFRTSNHVCKKENCFNKSLEGVNFCLEHHIKSLQNIGNLPKEPQGELFPPYDGIFNKYKSHFSETIRNYR